MAVKKFIQPAYATETNGNTYAAKIEDALAVLALSPLGQFAPYASSPPDLSINISAGNIKDEFGIALGGTGTVIGAAQQVNLNAWVVATVHTILVMPVSQGRIDRIYIDIFQGILRRVVGVESEFPIAPAYPESAIPICQVQLSVGQTMITNAHITDERGMVGNDSPVAGIGGVSTVFGNAVGYEIFDVAGTYSLTKPPGARFYRLTGAGAGGGSGGSYFNGTNLYYGGGGGGGSTIEGLLLAACDLAIVVGAGGVLGADSTGVGLNNAVNGSTGGTTSITTPDALVINLNPGVGGNRAVSTPANGAGGAGGVATFGGVAGVNGTSGVTNVGATGGGTGTGASFGVGSLSALSKNGAGGGVQRNGSDGLVMIEWF